MELKIFSFLPNGNGENSVYIVDTNKENAIKRIEEYIKNNKQEKNPEWYGWGTKYYECIEHNINEIILNDNC